MKQSINTPVGQKISEYMNSDPKKIIHYERKISEDSLKQYLKLDLKMKKLIMSLHH